MNLSTEAVTALLEYRNGYADKFEVNNPLRLSYFLAQLCYQSNGFRITEEGLYYSTPVRLLAVWPSGL